MDIKFHIGKYTLALTVSQGKFGAMSINKAETCLLRKFGVAWTPRHTQVLQARYPQGINDFELLAIARQFEKGEF